MSEPRTSCCVPVVKFPHGQASRQQLESEILKAKIARAEASGPRAVTQHATIMDISPDGTLSTLREGSNQWTAFPGNENQIGNVPMCCDPMGLQWVMDILEDKPRPTNSRPGLIYMLCGATQHSNVDHTDHESPPIPIGPHYMIIWPF
ncbi:hypothetical protein ACCO45_009924 [Purpureocillium lilacinum]|uniref:Uncharacterized protein n=1 Tax=Purpureocillium lilacinum TaxID=33203 RepID=A0ACC4DDE0_PURLI